MVDDSVWEVTLAGDIPRFTVSVPGNDRRRQNIVMLLNLPERVPDPDPELVEIELLPGEGVPGSGDRPRAAESAETAN